VLIPPTNPAAFFRLACPDFDEPDDAFVDSNCDGIDGSISNAVFVAASGDDENPGTASLPVRTMTNAIARAASQKKDVYVAAGIYFSSAADLRNGVSIYGGFNSNGWSRSASNAVVWNIDSPAGLRAANLTATTLLDHITIVSADNTNGGGSAYGIFATNSPGLVIRQCVIRSGNGGAGLNGSSGAAGTNGGPGSIGNPGCENSSSPFCDTCDRPAGGAPGTSPCERAGGAGGRPGNAAAGGEAGGTGAGGTLGGPGAPGESQNGTPGEDGTNGGDGTNGLAGIVGLMTEAGYVVTNATDGTAGGPGNGGGGGGGGGGGTTDCDSYGSSGGGGGAGACGGTAGGGGQSGGGSFALYLVNSPVVVERSTLITGHGGNGGSGGSGGSGGTGGAGGPGGPYGGASEQDDGGSGAKGGKGGDGGRGGHGGGGAGGPSIAIASASGPGAQLLDVTFTLGSAGAGGASSGNAGPGGLRVNVFP